MVLTAAIVTCIHCVVIRQLIFCNPEQTISYTPLSIPDFFCKRRQDVVRSLSSHAGRSDLLERAGRDRSLFVYTTTHSPWKRASQLHLNSWGELPPLIHNEIPGGFTIDTAWWTLMRCFWKDEPKSALLLGLQAVGWRRKKGGKRIFCQVRGKQYWSICIVSLILPEVWIPLDQYLATASLFFCVTYYCRWNARPTPQLELCSRQGQSIA